ncbi:uncharacterized protein [Drosophila tropicalis]|uniref:uncharacterized protein n=1 Tax=Drosophila tropicalis TaxID=46794 RepID=UPI0035ABE48A
MHNLIKSKALLQILKSPLPDIGNIEEEFGDKVKTRREWGMKWRTNVTHGKLNAHATEFVPLSKQLEEPKETVDFGKLKRHFESFDEANNKAKLTLPWKGFPRSQMRPDNPGTARNPHVISMGAEEYLIVSGTKRPKKEKESVGSDTKSEPKVKSPNVNQPKELVDESEVKRRENERKVALEAIKLVEQRRMREPLVPLKSVVSSIKTDANKQPIIHLTRSPVNFNSVERDRVNRLRIAKRSRIELVLKEMHKESHQRSGPDPASFIVIESKNPATTTTKNKIPKRYIPTVKEWDEQCKMKMAKTTKENRENKENNGKKHSVSTQGHSDNQNPSQRYTTTSSSNHFMLPGIQSLSYSPKYVPPGLVLAGETRRGNLTHAGIFVAKPNSTRRNHLGGNVKVIKRYSIEQLLQLEPQPGDLQMPRHYEILKKFDIFCD